MSSMVATAGWTGIPKASERRGSARSPLFMLVQARGGTDPLWAWDIGLGGMQCRSRDARWPGTYLDLSFQLPGTADRIETGGQVLSLEKFADESVSLGVRFCMLSVRAQRAIYRFLDARRSLWSREQSAANEQPAAATALNVRPFETLLLEAYASLRAKELRPTAFVRAPLTEGLPRLSELLRAPLPGMLLPAAFT